MHNRARSHDALGCFEVALKCKSGRVKMNHDDVPTTTDHSPNGKTSHCSPSMTEDLVFWAFGDKILKLIAAKGSPDVYHHREREGVGAIWVIQRRLMVRLIV